MALVTPKIRVDHADLAREIVQIEQAIEEKVTIALAAGAANGMLITIQAVDGQGNTLAGVRNLRVFASRSNVGAGLTSQAYSGDLVASTGVIINETVSKKVWDIQTDATGKFIGTLTDTAKPATEYICVVRPRGSLTVSAASGTSWG